METSQPRPTGSLKSLGQLWPLVTHYRVHISAAAIFLIISAAATLVLPIAVRQVIDQGFAAGQVEQINQWFWYLFAAASVMAFAGGLRFYFVSWLGQRIITDLRRKVYAQIMQLSPWFFETTKTGEVLSRLNTDTTLVESLVGSNISFVLRNMVMLLAAAVMLVVTSPKLAGYMSIMIPLIVVPILILGRRVRKHSRNAQDRIADFTAQGVETINAIQTVQAMAQELRETLRFEKAVENAFSANLRLIRANVILIVSVILLAFGGIVFVLWLGAQAVLSNNLTPGELGQFVLYALIVASAVGGLGEMWGSVQRAAGALERLLELLNTEPDIRTLEQPVDIAEVCPPGEPIEVRFNNVHFAYPSQADSPVLQQFDLSIQPGETIALVGPSGAGKSTLIQLLLRFYDPQSGTINVNNTNIRELDPTALRRHVALVPQDVVIFSDNIRENIRYGKPDATNAEVKAAARLAYADEFIDKMPDGYDTFLGERGQRLSGGQRQRIAIARAVLLDPPLLIMDEATSSLDAQSERHVQHAIETLRKNRSLLIIAHRLATIRQADRIVLLNNGTIEAIGKHDELIRKSELYAHLAALQFMQ